MKLETVEIKLLSREQIEHWVKKIFAHQYTQEMADTQESKSRSREWVERLPAVLKVMNNEVTRLTRKTPASSIKQKEVST